VLVVGRGDADGVEAGRREQRPVVGADGGDRVRGRHLVSPRGVLEVIASKLAP
jgi:hypothetical protein